MIIKPLTMEQAIIISAYTGFMICPFSKLHEAIEKKLGRPVFTHQLGTKPVWDEIHKGFTDDFLDVVNTFTEDQKIIISAYTKIVVTDSNKVMKAINKKLGGTDPLHELGPSEYWGQVYTAFKDDFLSLAPIECEEMVKKAKDEVKP